MLAKARIVTSWPAQDPPPPSPEGSDGVSLPRAPYHPIERKGSGVGREVRVHLPPRPRKSGVGMLGRCASCGIGEAHRKSDHLCAHTSAW